MSDYLVKCIKLMRFWNLKICFLVLFPVAIPKLAFADLVFGVPALLEVKSLLESSSCVQRCANAKWFVERVTFRAKFSSQLLPGDAVFLVSSTPSYCGASRCPQGYVLRDLRRFSILKNGYNISTTDPLRIEEIPTVTIRQQLPGLERTNLFSDAGYGTTGSEGGCRPTAPTGVEELLQRQASDMYLRALRAPLAERRELLRRTLALIDSLVEVHPDSAFACQVREPAGRVGGVPVTQVRAELAGLEPAVFSPSPASVNDALALAAASGPTVDLVKAYMWTGQFERGMQLLSAGVAATYSDPGGVESQRYTDTHVEVANWLTTQGRSDLALRVLNQAERGVSAMQWSRWVPIAKGYSRAGAVSRAQAIFARWERAVIASVQRAEYFHQDTQRLIETYVELGRIHDVRRVAATLPIDDCGYPFYQGGYRLQSYLGQHQQALEAARRCRDPVRQMVIEASIAEIVLGLAESGDIQTAQTLLQRHRIDMTTLYYAETEHSGVAYARALGKAGRREEARVLISRTRGLLASAAPACKENYGDPVLRGLIGLLEIGFALEMPEESFQTAQAVKRYVSRIGQSVTPNCTVDFLRLAQALLALARQDAMAGRTEQSQVLAREAEALAGSGEGLGQRVLAGTLALAMAQRNPNRLPVLGATSQAAASATGAEPPTTSTSDIVTNTPTSNVHALHPQSPALVANPATSCAPMPLEKSQRHVYASRTDFEEGFLIRRPSSVPLSPTVGELFNAEFNQFLSNGRTAVRGDSCYLAALDAMKVAENKRFVTHAFNELVTNVWSASVSSVPSMVDAFPRTGFFMDASVKIGGDAVAAFFTDQNALQAAGFSFVREMTGSVISKETGSHFFGSGAGIMLDWSKTSLESLLKEEGVLSWSLRGDNDKTEYYREGLVLKASVKARNYYNPWSRRVSSAIAATCPEVSSKTRLYFLDYEVERVETPGTTHFGSARFVTGSLNASHVPLQAPCR